jgi:hypothetical protein
MSSILLVCFVKDGVCVSTQSFNIDADPVQDILLHPPADCDFIKIILQRLDSPPPQPFLNKEWENSQDPDTIDNSSH